MSHFVFFLGTHRTGTKTIARFFDERVPGVVGVHQHNSSRWLNVASNAYHEGLLPEAALRIATERLFLRRLRRETADVYVEANGFNYLGVQYALQEWPEAKVVHLVRDPRAFVASWLNWTTTRWRSRIAHTVIPCWNLTGARCGVSPSEWRAWDAFTRACWLWKYKNTLITDLYGDEPGAYCRVRLEDLTDAPDRAIHLRAMLVFLDLPYEVGMEAFFDEPLNVSKGATLRTWTSWSDRECRTLEAHCGPLMRQYGYGDEAAWRERIGGVPVAGAGQ